MTWNTECIHTSTSWIQNASFNYSMNSAIKPINKKTMDKKKTILSMFIDSNGAHDPVWTLKLLHKMWETGTWIQCFCATKANEHKSLNRPIKGYLKKQFKVSQFNIIINYLSHKISEVNNSKSVFLEDDLVMRNQHPIGTI